VKTSKAKKALDEANKKFKEEHTFKPQIKDYPVPPSKELSKGERWKKLTQPKTADQQNREKEKLHREQEEFSKVCTFKPQLQVKETSRDKENEQPWGQRLLHEGDKRKEKREKLKKEAELQQMKDCSFKPNLVSSKSQVVNSNKFNSQQPIHERVTSLQREKNERLQRLRMKGEQEDKNLTFQPKVNDRSAKMHSVKRGGDGDVVDRLYRDAHDRIEKTLIHEEQLSKEHPFQPHISKSSAGKLSNLVNVGLSEKSDMFNGNLKDFYERQQKFIEKQAEKRELAKATSGEEARCTFRPEINVTSEIICEADPKRGTETEEERYMRLYRKVKPLNY